MEHLADHHLLWTSLVGIHALLRYGQTYTQHCGETNTEVRRLVIAATMFIYLRAGRTIYDKRKQLYDFTDPNTEADPHSLKTTEVCVTTEPVDSIDGIVPASLTSDHHGSSSRAGHNLPAPPAAYSVTITADMTHEGGADDGTNTNGVSEAAAADGTEPHTTVGNIQVGAPPPSRHQRRRNLEMNSAAWSYTKCAILFFTAMLITWIPSSANRVYSVLNDGTALVGLEYASAFVLPLQGLWNCIIYIVTSWTGCKNYFREIGLAPRARVVESLPLRSDFGGRREGKGKRFETESMTELQTNRSSSHE